MKFGSVQKKYLCQGLQNHQWSLIFWKKIFVLILNWVRSQNQQINKNVNNFQNSFIWHFWYDLEWLQVHKGSLKNRLFETIQQRTRKKCFPSKIAKLWSKEPKLHIIKNGILPRNFFMFFVLSMFYRANATHIRCQFSSLFTFGITREAKMSNIMKNNHLNFGPS